MTHSQQELLREIAHTALARHLAADGYVLTRVYPYESAEGALIYVKARFEHETKRKEIRPFERNGTSWKCRAPEGRPRPLYRLPAIYASPRRATVWYAEGESCVEALEAFDLVATTAGGANSDETTDYSPLYGRTIIIWPDNDKVGMDHAQRVAGELRSRGSSVSFVDVARLTLPEKGDAVDWLRSLDAPNRESLQSLPRLDEISSPCTPELVAKPPADRERRGQGTPRPNEVVQQVQVGKRRYVSWSIKGLTVTEDDEDDELPAAMPRQIAGSIRVVAEVRDPQSEGWSKLVAWDNKDGLPRRAVISASEFLDTRSGFLKRLVDGGLHVAAGPAPKRMLVEFLEAYRPDEKALLARQMGWCSNVFVAGENGYCRAEDDQAVLLATTPPTGWMASKGDITDWKSSVSIPAGDHSRLVLAISLAFAGPLLDVVGEPSGCVHFYGASSTGKSTALAVAASVYGAPQMMRRSWRATANALESVASLHNDSALFLDELHEIDPSELYKAAYMLGNGQGKSRSKAEGGLRTTLQWRVLILSSGEVRADQYISSSGRAANAGQSVRIVDVPSPSAGRGIFDAVDQDESPAELADALNSCSAAFHGVAGEHWLRRLSERRVADPEGLSDQVSKRRDVVLESWLEGRGLEPVQRRVAKKFALIGVAGELATEYGLTGWTPGRATECARVCFEAWVAEAQAKGERQKRQIVDRWEQLVARHGSSRFERVGDGGAQPPCSDRLGWVRPGASGAEEYLMPCAVFAAELADGMPLDVVRTTLEQAGVLVRPRGGGCTHRVRLGAEGQLRVYVLRCRAG